MALSTCLPRLRIYSDPPHAHARNRIGIGSCCYQVGVGVGCRGPTRVNTICSSGGSDLASTAFTFGTAAVLPFYTLMILAPKAQLTRRAMDSTIPYTVLGLVYAYLVYLSWTPDTLRLMFATKYWLPELPGVAKMFSSEMTLASAWIHLLTGDLFAARCIYQEGLEKEIETRHSLTLCMFICPLGILTHTITKALTPTPTSYGIRSTKHSSDHK